MRNVLGSKEERTRVRVLRLISYVEGKFALETPEAFIFVLMKMLHTWIAIRKEKS